jgi:hypothetical protein
MRAAVALMISTLLPLGSCARPAPPYENPTLCQLAEHREAYADRLVEVEGELLSSRHGSVVSDPRCGYGVGISWWESDVPRMQEFDRIARRADGEPIRARVRVQGVMRQDENVGMSGERAWSLHLSQAHVLRAVRLSEDDWRRYLAWYDGPSSEPFRPTQQPVPVSISEASGEAR